MNSCNPCNTRKIHQGIGSTLFKTYIIKQITKKSNRGEVVAFLALDVVPPAQGRRFADFLMSSPLDVSPWFGWLMKAFGDLSLFLWSVQPSPIPFQAQTRSCSLLHYCYIPTHLCVFFFNLSALFFFFLNAIFHLFCSPQKVLIPHILSLKIPKT